MIFLLFKRFSAPLLKGRDSHILQAAAYSSEAEDALLNIALNLITVYASLVSFNL